jgi:hypothetical protein
MPVSAHDISSLVHSMTTALKGCALNKVKNFYFLLGFEVYAVIIDSVNAKNAPSSAVFTGSVSWGLNGFNFHILAGGIVNAVSHNIAISPLTPAQIDKVVVQLVSKALSKMNTKRNGGKHTKVNICAYNPFFIKNYIKETTSDKNLTNYTTSSNLPSKFTKEFSDFIRDNYRAGLGCKR